MRKKHSDIYRNFKSEFPEYHVDSQEWGRIQRQPYKVPEGTDLPFNSVWIIGSTVVVGPAGMGPTNHA